MKPAEFALGDARVRHWDLDQLDSSLPLAAQRSSLKEDLAWSELSKGVTIDVGWYRTAFVIHVIIDGDWDSPAERREATSLADLTRELHAAIAFARTLT